MRRLLLFVGPLVAALLFHLDRLRVRPAQLVAIRVVQSDSIVVGVRGHRVCLANRASLLDQVPIRQGDGRLLAEDDIAELVA